MPNIRDIKRRIKSVQSTGQITKAMKMVSAAKLRRAQSAIIAARPYAKKMNDVLSSLAVRVEQDSHPFFTVRPENRVLVVVITGDRGLCGAFNNNILRFAHVNMKEKWQSSTLSIVTIGKKARDYFSRRYMPVKDTYSGITDRVPASKAGEIVEGLTTKYLNKEIDAIYLIYNEFKSAMQQKPCLFRLLPIAPISPSNEKKNAGYIFEPSEQSLFENLLPKYVFNQFLRAILESSAAEHGARMSAMENASQNAKKMINSLTLYANRIRQASITKELIEIVSGAEALKEV